MVPPPRPRIQVDTAAADVVDFACCVVADPPLPSPDWTHDSQTVVKDVLNLLMLDQTANAANDDDDDDDANDENDGVDDGDDVLMITAANHPTTMLLRLNRMLVLYCCRQHLYPRHHHQHR